MDDDPLRRSPSRAAPQPTGSGRRPRVEEPDLAETLTRAVCTAGLLVSLILVALATLTPEGSGWRWGAPGTELRWYLHGFGSPATMLQLLGNLALLALPAAFAVRRWPVLRRLPVLAGVALASGTAIETLQWALPLGRVVSPMDALLNATGAVVAGFLVARALRRRAARTRQWAGPVPYLSSRG
ncbi:MAG: VanZ family protein [Frankiales bacterium]|nr:VanZ family protein [Frankiales bacterium]